MPAIPDSAITGFFLLLIALVPQCSLVLSARRVRRENREQHGVTADEMRKVVKSVNHAVASVEQMGSQVNHLGNIVVSQGLSTLDTLGAIEDRLDGHIRDASVHTHA